MKEHGRKIRGDEAYQAIDLPEDPAEEPQGGSHAQETYKNGVKPVHIMSNRKVTGNRIQDTGEKVLPVACLL